MVNSLLLLSAIASLFYQGSLAGNGCCSKFSQQQEVMLRALLKEEANQLKQGMQRMCPKSRWTILNTTEPCFGAKGNKPARFTIKWEGFLAAFKIVHTKGEVNCDTRQTKHSFASKWGCSTRHPNVGTTPLGTFITTPPTPTRRILFPREKFIPNKSPTMWYALPGFHPDSPFLVFHDFANPEFVQYGQEVEIWYGEDMQGVSEDDNDGESCVEVFAWYL